MLAPLALETLLTPQNQNPGKYTDCYTSHCARVFTILVYLLTELFGFRTGLVFVFRMLSPNERFLFKMLSPNERPPGKSRRRNK